MINRIVLSLSFLLLLLSGCRVIPDEPGYMLRAVTPTAAPADVSPVADLPRLALEQVQAQGLPLAKLIGTQPGEFSLQSGSPVAMPAFLHTDSGCGWQGMAGQFFDAHGQPVSGVIVAVVGNLGGESVEAVTTTGAQSGYGPGGYELQLAAKSAPGIFWMQAFSATGQPVTEIVEFQLAGECERNLLLFNFRDTSGDTNLFLPVITH